MATTSSATSRLPRVVVSTQRCTRCNPVLVHIPISGTFYFFGARWLPVPLSLATAHEGATGLDTSVATEPHRVAGSRGVHVRCSSAPSHPVYAYQRFDDALVCLSPLPPFASPSSSNFVGSHQWACNRSRPSFYIPTCLNRRPEHPGTLGRERISRALFVCLSRPRCCGCCELSSPRNKRSSGSMLSCFRGPSPQSRFKSEKPEL